MSLDMVALLTLGTHAQEGYGSWVCVCVCLSVKSHLTSGASVRPENTVTYSAGNGFSLKPLRCRDPALPSLKTISMIGHFPVESKHVHYSIGFMVFTTRWCRGFCTLVHSWKYV